MTFAVIVFPGSNCDHDAYHAVKHVLGADAEFVWHKDTTLGGVDVVILGNADLASFSGFAQDRPEYHDLQARTRNATYRAGKLWGNAAFGNATGNPLSADSRLHQNGPSNDGWTRPGGGGGA